MPHLDNTSKAIPIRGLAHTPRKLVCVKTSLLPGAGNGLFAAKEICTYATNIKSRAQQIAFKICPYTGDPPGVQHSEYVITVGKVSVDAARFNSCWPRFINDALNVELDNVTAILIDGVIWIVPLPGVEILQHQELYLSYDWEFWYRKWLTCDPQLRERILRRYSVSSSTPHLSASPTADEIAEIQRVSDFWYKHWSWWSHDMRRQIIRNFKLANYEAYDLDAETIPCELEQDVQSDSDLEVVVEHRPAEQPELSDAEHRRHGPTQAPVDPAPAPLPAPRMIGSAASPTTNLLPQSDIDQSDRPVIAPAPIPLPDPNSQRPAQLANHPPLKVWEAESRSEWKVPTNMYSDISGSHWKNFCAVMDTWPDSREDIIGSMATSSDLRVGYLNVNLLEDHNFDYILWFYEAKCLDVLFLIDTRLTVLGGQYANAKIKERLGNDILILQSKTRPIPGSGGQLAIVRPHLRKHLVNEETDPANLGVLFALTFAHGLRKLVLASVYWPCETQGPASLRTRLAEYMTATDRPGTITSYCRHLVENVLDRTMEDPLNTVIVGGDWNANWLDSVASPRRSHSAIAHWAQDIGLYNAHKGLITDHFNTRYPSISDVDRNPSAIDHILQPTELASSPRPESTMPRPGMQSLTTDLCGSQLASTPH